MSIIIIIRLAGGLQGTICFCLQHLLVLVSTAATVTQGAQVPKGTQEAGVWGEGCKSPASDHMVTRGRAGRETEGV